ncbi:hypothetical protein SEA_SOOS_29 [Gordonia phage Soos]|nr:hypothetical protein SEA_SOOS_29 [Gordonia phage Soos]
MPMSQAERRRVTRERDGIAVAAQYLRGRGYDLLADKLDVVTDDLTEDLEED